MTPSRSQAVDSRRRSFLKKGLAAGGISFVTNRRTLIAQVEDEGRLTKGDAALLRFAAAAEILESDFWVQYNELGGIPDKEVPGGTGNSIYAEKLKNLDED